MAPPPADTPLSLYLLSIQSLLLPRPKQVRLLDDSFAGSDEPVVATFGEWNDPSIQKALLDRLAQALSPLTRQPWLRVNPDDAAPNVRLRLHPGRGADEKGRGQAYKLKVDASGIEIEAFDASGIFYGLVTLQQWVTLHTREVARFRTVPGIDVEDTPDFRYRGVMLDISRNRVPRIDFLEGLIERLALLKINQLQLYTEHTFAYRGHEAVWQNASPLTPEEIQRLDRFCRERFIELVPNQNSFGHFHRWLVHEPYRALAECPEGIDHPFAHDREPFSLCPTDPGVFSLLEDLYDQLLPNFRSRTLNVGLDETFDLGKGRSAALCEDKGTTEVYLDFLRQVHRRVEARGYRMQFWGDIIVQKPELIDQLPRNAIALEWGYEADHPFDRHAKAFADSGLEFYVCPGTSSWNSLLGRTDNALGNLAAAAREGQRNHASGYLITDWGDFGHLQPPCVSYPGFLAGAAEAWNTGSAPGADDKAILADLVARHFLYDDSEARPSGDGFEDLNTAQSFASELVALGSAYLLPGDPPMNGSHLFYLLLFADQGLDQKRFRGLARKGLESARDRLTDYQISGKEPFERDGGIAQRELAWAAALASVGARLGLARLGDASDDIAGAIATANVPSAERQQLRRELKRLDKALPELWLERSREGGLERSRQQISRMIETLS